MRAASFNSPLLPTHQLCMDVVRGLLPAHGPRVGLHLGAETRAVAYSFRMEFAGDIFNTLRRPPGLCERGS